MSINDQRIHEICKAIFAVGDVHVVEEYSEFDKEPLVFSNQSDLENYMVNKIMTQKGYAGIFVTYPEMGGKARLKKISLDRNKVPEYKFRYTWEGWGLISVRVAFPQPHISSDVSANTETRAIKWSEVYPDFEPPSIWNWKEVTRHKNRLKRVLTKYC